MSLPVMGMGKLGAVALLGEQVRETVTAEPGQSAKPLNTSEANW